MSRPEDHIEPTRVRESPPRLDGGMTLMVASAMAVGLAVAVPVGIALFAVDIAAWGLQIVGRHARRGTGRALVWLIGEAKKRI